MLLKRLYSLGILCILILGWLIYSPAMHGEFLFDDQSFIVGNSHIREFNPVSLWKSYEYPTRFIAFLSFSINYQVHGLDPFGYHFMNVLIHMLNALSVWTFVVLLFRTKALADHRWQASASYLGFFIALLFLVHPLQTQAVSYISQRFASLATFFYLLSVNTYLLARLNQRRKIFWLIASLGLGVCAMFTKQISFTLPFMIMAIECFFMERNVKKLWKGGWFFLPLVLTLPLMYRFRWQAIFHDQIPSGSHDGDVITFWTYMLTQVEVVSRYIQLYFWPQGQNLDYDFPLAKFTDPQWMLSFIFLTMIVWLVFWLFSKDRLMSFGLCWFFLALSVESSIIPLRHIIFEHRTYLPSVGMFIFIGACFWQIRCDRYVRMTAMVIILSVLCALTFMRNQAWQSRLAMWQDVVKKSPAKTRPYINLGRAYGEDQQWSKALAMLDKALLLNPQSSIALTNRGFIYRHLKQYNDAMRDLNQAIVLRPQNYVAYNQRGLIYAYGGKYPEALADFNQALEIRPYFASALQNQQRVYELMGKTKSVIPDKHPAQSINP